MRSIKPGRGPSLRGILGSAASILFGIIWIAFTVSIGGGLFALFGLGFIIMAAVNLIYNIKNAFNKNRYSEFDITEDGEEPDSFEQRFGRKTDYTQNSSTAHSGDFNSSQTLFCPFCGSPVKDEHKFCKNCGRQLAD
jgi:high-affinity Fe2+/Pb2+ permease